MIYFAVLICAIPFMFYLLQSLNFEHLFKQGRVVQIRVAYVVASLILSHFIAEIFSNIINVFMK